MHNIYRQGLLIATFIRTQTDYGPVTKSICYLSTDIPNRESIFNA